MADIIENNSNTTSTEETQVQEAQNVQAVEDDVPYVEAEAVVETMENLGTAVQNTSNSNLEGAPKLDPHKALKEYSEEERNQVLALADQIDMRQLDKIMHYGASVLEKTFDQCGEFLKDERGSVADQMVMKMVTDLAKKAKDSHSDFQLTIKEPNFLQNIILKLSASQRSKRGKKIQTAALSNYKLLTELKASSQEWIKLLQDAMTQIYKSATGDMETMRTLQKYLIAGKLAQERIPAEMAAIKQKYEETGLIEYSQEYDEYDEGAKTFELTMANLEASYDLYYVSLAQLKMIKDSNIAVQKAVNTQMTNTMTAMSQQIRNGVLNAKNREVMEGHKALNRLNDELIQEISKSVGLTAKESEKMLYTSFVDIDAATKAVTSIITSCDEIQKVAETMLPKMKADVSKFTKLIEQLEPHVEKIRVSNNNNANAAGNAPQIEGSSASASDELKF